MLETTAFPSQPVHHQRRLRTIVKRLVIELGYLEHCLDNGLRDPQVETAAAGIDTAIDCLNQHLTQ